MKLTIRNRIKLCFEILTIRSGHAHTAQEKQLSTFLRGYRAGMKDEQSKRQSEIEINPNDYHTPRAKLFAEILSTF